jgi:hypothetical protein
MNRIGAVIFILIIMSVCFSGIFIQSCREQSIEGMIIFSEVKGQVKDINYVSGTSWRYIPLSRIVLMNPGKPGNSSKVLTYNFFSACSPQISYDGKNLLFAAQQKQNDPWQIWEMNLINLKMRQVTSSRENCIDPEYLPDERIVFSRLNVNDTLKAGHSLYTCNPDGSKLTRITFNPHTYFASTVLKDGRVLSISRRVYPDIGEQSFVALRPDGTKAELFYEGGDCSTLAGRAREMANGKIVFIESDKKSQNTGNVITISYNRPLHTRENLTSGIKGDFNNVFPMPSGKMLVSYRQTETDHYALYEFDPVKKILSKPVYCSPDYDVLEVVMVRKTERPKKLPSEVDMGVKTGLLLCQDLNISGLSHASITSSLSKAYQIEVIGIDSSLGKVQAEKDGSFYLKVMADKPFKFRTLDDKGNLLGNSCEWIWIRPNERRGCVGCHEDHEMVPENRVPMAVKNLPVNIPVHINRVKEKTVSLE